MVSEPIQRSVWEGFLDVARLSRYYEALADRYQKFYVCIRVALLISVFASVASPIVFQTERFSWIAVAITVIVTAFLAAADYVGDFAKKSAVLHGISVQVKRLEIEWELLWYETGTADAVESEMLKKNMDHQFRLLEITERFGGEGIFIDGDLNLRCMEEAYKIMEERYSYVSEHA